MKKLIEKQFIQGNAVDKSSHYTTLETVNYEAINWGFKNWVYSNDCFKEKEIFLKQTITDHVYKGNQLFYYPDLAKQIRKLEAYPYLIKEYPINREKKGIDFLLYLAHYANECLQAFKNEQLEKYKNINNLIQIYGHDRYLPIIQEFKEQKEEGRYYPDQIITINGVKWYIDDRGSRSSHTGSINPRELFNISLKFRHVMIEQVLLGTPFVALKCCTHEYNKGHVFWYDLSTLEKTTKAQALLWRKPK